MQLSLINHWLTRAAFEVPFRLVCGFFFLLPGVVNSQENLVPNPGFEKIKGTPVMVDDLSKAVPWSAINSADHFDQSTTSKNRYRVESFSVDVFKPRTGNMYAGLRFQDTYDEYMQVKLLKPLQAGEEYRISFWISGAESSGHLVNSIGAALSAGQTDVEKAVQLKYAVYKENEAGIKTGPSWTEITGTYVANGDERYLILGNFKEPVAKKMIRKPVPNDIADKLSNWIESYYYIDDVSVVHLPKASNSVSIQYDQPLVLSNILFEPGKDVLLSSSYAELDKLASSLMTENAGKLIITGHTDNQGGEETNLTLSRKRAQSVAKYLAGKGIAADRLVAEGKGSTLPVADNSTEEGRSKNRRVEFLLAR